MRNYKVAVLVGFAFVLVMAAGARAAGQEWSLAPNEPPAVIRGGAADDFKDSATDQTMEEMAPASAAPDMSDEEMTPATPAPYQGSDEMAPATSTPEYQEEGE
jgi:hypothetical protein